MAELSGCLGQGHACLWRALPLPTGDPLDPFLEPHPQILSSWPTGAQEVGTPNWSWPPTGGERRRGSRRAGREPDGLASIPSLTRSSCVTLGKCLHFSVQLPHLWRENNKAMRGPTEATHAESLAQRMLEGLLLSTPVP